MCSCIRHATFSSCSSHVGRCRPGDAYDTVKRLARDYGLEVTVLPPPSEAMAIRRGNVYATLRMVGPQKTVGVVMALFKQLKAVRIEFRVVSHHAARNVASQVAGRRPLLVGAFASDLVALGRVCRAVGSASGQRSFSAQPAALTNQAHLIATCPIGTLEELKRLLHLSVRDVLRRTIATVLTTPGDARSQPTRICARTGKRSGDGRIDALPHG